MEPPGHPQASPIDPPTPSVLAPAPPVPQIAAAPGALGAPPGGALAMGDQGMAATPTPGAMGAPPVPGAALAKAVQGIAAAPGAMGAPTSAALAMADQIMVVAPGAMAKPPDGLDAQAAGADGPSPTDTSAVALARMLLPTVPHLAIECNRPRLDVQRSQVDDVDNMESVDWDTIRIVETHDEEGRIDIMSESQMCELLGLTDEVTTNIRARPMDEEMNDNEFGQNTDGAAIPTSDDVPTREEILRDSPGRVTRSKLAMLLGEGASSQTDNTSPVRMSTMAPPKKLTPKRKLHIG
ncbi:unnamed protein product [Urochloa humidicola]